MNEVTQLVQEASRLPEDQRLTLAHRILSLSDVDPSEEQQAAWDREIRQRIQRYDDGLSKARSVSDVFESLDQRLSR